MGVIAYKISSGVTFRYEFECGTFDLASDSGGLDGWTEIARDCDHWPSTRRTLTPYASGNKGASDIVIDFNERIGHHKYIETTDDTMRDVLDLSDINGGQLPTTPCAWMQVIQNGKKLPCSAYTVDYTTAEITIVEAWRVPGASYEVIFYAPLAV